jgi:hypothetical protein
MMMFKKFKNIVSHPSLLGLYFMDHWYTVVGWWFLFFCITCVFLSIVDLTKPRLDSNVARRISDALAYNHVIDDAKYENNTLTGSYKVIETEYCIISFNDNAFMNNHVSSGLIVVFGKENANVFFSTFHLGRLNYSDLKIKDFNIKDIKSGNIEMRIAFESFIEKGLSSGEANYRAICFFNDLFGIIMYYLLTLVVCYFLAWIINPMVERRFRIKLIGYSSLIYYLFIWCKLSFSMDALLYIGIFFSLVYTVFTFTHIRLVRVGRRKK